LHKSLGSNGDTRAHITIAVGTSFAQNGDDVMGSVKLGEYTKVFHVVPENPKNWEPKSPQGLDRPLTGPRRAVVQ